MVYKRAKIYFKLLIDKICFKKMCVMEKRIILHHSDNNLKTMKKIVTVLAVASIALFYACGPSAEEKALKEKAKNDSITAAELKRLSEQDSIANAMKLVAFEDSVKRATDSIAALGAKKPNAPVKTKDQKNMDVIKDLKGNDKTPAEKKKDAENIKVIKNLKGGK
jgi:hypothetical protein